MTSQAIGIHHTNELCIWTTLRYAHRAQIVEDMDALSVTASLVLQPKVPLDRPAFSLDCHLEQVVGVEDVNSIWHEGEVVDTAIGDREFTKEDTFRVPSAMQSQY